MHIDKKKIERTFRAHYAKIKDDTEAWNLTLDEIAGPYDPEETEEKHETRMKISNMLRGIAKRVRIEAGVEADIDWNTVVHEDYDVEGLANDLKKGEWFFVEPRRIERRVFIASWKSVLSLVVDRIPQSVLDAAEEDDTRLELESDESDAYIDALAAEVAKAMRGPPQIVFGPDYSQEHVFGTFDEGGDAFIGQYEEGSPEKLEAWVESRGEKIED